MAKGRLVSSRIVTDHRLAALSCATARLLYVSMVTQADALGRLRGEPPHVRQAMVPNEPGVADDWLMIPIVDQLVASGVVLGAGQCYSFRQLPVLGGTYTPENRMAFPIREHFGGWGSVHRQMADLPDGSHVIIKPVG